MGSRAEASVCGEETLLSRMGVSQISLGLSLPTCLFSEGLGAAFVNELVRTSLQGMLVCNIILLIITSVLVF